MIITRRIPRLLQVRRLVTRTCANFAHFPQYRQFIVRDAIFPLIKCLGDVDREIRHAGNSSF